MLSKTNLNIIDAVSYTHLIAKALSKDVKLLILDEPTASLNESDSKALLELLLQFKRQGMTSIIISHKLNEISYVADKITIIRDGSTIETLVKGVDDFSEERIIKGMVGRDTVSYTHLGRSDSDFRFYVPERCGRFGVQFASHWI